jgi:NADH:ubiquinone oxidoreductase subunit C
MSTVEITPEIMEFTEPYVEDHGVYWFSYDDLTVRELAKAMNAVRARFVTITAYELPKNEGFRLEYHWDLAGRLLGFTFNLAGNSMESASTESASIESIYDLCEAVDWIEREVHEEYGIEFTGRRLEPLLLREGDTVGLNMREMAAPAPVTKEAAK